MLPRAPWMTDNDIVVLEFFDQHADLALPPTVVWYNLQEYVNVSQSTIKRRMRELADYNLLEKDDDTRGYHILSEKGQQYLSGELDREDLQGSDTMEDA